MYILEPYFVTMEKCLFQRSRSTPPSMIYTTLKNLTNGKTEADLKTRVKAQKN